MTPPTTDDLRSHAHLIAMSVAEEIWGVVAAPDGLRATTDGRLPWAKRTPTGEHVAREFSLADGYPAVTLLFAELAARDRSWAPRLHAVLQAAAPLAGAAPMSGLYNGAVSLAFALRMARIGTGGYGSALGKLHAAVGRSLERQLSSGSMRKQIAARGLALMDYDLVSGLSGMLRYLLLEPSDGTDLITLLLTELVHLARVDQGRPGWTAQEPPSFDSDPADFPFGHANVGVAHGAAGMLAALAVATSAGMVVPGQPQAIETISEWLIGSQLTEAEGINWPPFLAIGMGAVIGTKQHKGWCYGVPGIARALQLAGKAVGNRRWMEVAAAAMVSALARPVSDEAVIEPGLCHGWAGTMQVSWRFLADSPDCAIGEWIDSSAVRVLASYDPGSRFGFRSPQGPGPARRIWIDDGGFLTGAAGVALALERYSEGAAPATPWDAAMLLL